MNALHSLEIVTVDAFASQPFTGNPAAVCYTPEPLETDLMQAIAGELNLSETAFIHPTPNGSYHLRWFTPTTEVDLCGHATMAAAHVMWERGIAPNNKSILFNTRSGVLEIDHGGELISMNFPAEPVELITSAAVVSAVEHALQMSVSACGRNRMDFMAVLENEAAIRSVSPSMPAVAALPARGLIVTAAADDGSQYDFISRCFYPAVGVPEDPVTGSAHCAIGPYWSAQLGRKSLRGWQASARGGEVWIDCKGDRVQIKGKAVTVLAGNFSIKNCSLFSL